MSKTKANFFVSATPLFLVLFIDGMGLGLVIPLLNDLIFDPQAGFFSNTHYSPVIHNMIYGGIIGIFMFCWFLGAAILGDLSDQIGRKKSLSICLLGSFIGYILSAFAVIHSSLLLLILGRVIAGFTSGSQPIAQAAIIDLSVPEDKPRNIGLILFSMSLGFLFGPVLGGVLADPRFVSWFNYATPFYFAAMISFINIVILNLLFTETFVSKNTTLTINPYQAVNIFISAFRNKHVKTLSFLFFIFIFGWSSFYSFISLFLINVYHFSALQVSLFMGVMGLGFGIGTGFLVNFFARFFSLQSCFIWFSIISAMAIFLMMMIPHPIFAWLIMAPIAAAISTAYSCILTLFSNQVDENSQGWVMGITGSILAFVWAINGIIVGIIAAIHPAWALYIAVLFILLSALGMLLYFKPRSV